MSSAIKNPETKLPATETCSSQKVTATNDKTGEIDIDLIRSLKQDDPNNHVSAAEKAAVLEKLKLEHSSINQEIDKTMAESARKVDESTKVFNLRQMQLEQKVKELESKKVKTENELIQLIQQKNSSLHEDLRKVTRYLVNETKKLAPLEKELGTGVSNISHLKQEMQTLFESSKEDQKRYHEALEIQSKEIQNLMSLVKDCTKIITEDFHKLNTDVEPLIKQRVELNSKLNYLNIEILEAELRYKNFCQKLIHIDQEIEQKNNQVKALEDKSLELLQTIERINYTKSELIDLQEKKQTLQSSIDQAEVHLREIDQSGKKLESSILFLHEQYSRKKEIMQHTDKEIEASQSRLNLLKEDELTTLHSLNIYQGQINQLQAENSTLQNEKNTLQKLHQESVESLRKQKTDFQRETELLEENFKLKNQQWEQEALAKRNEWEIGFKFYMEQKEKTLAKSLTQLEQDFLVKWESERNSIHKSILEIISKHISQDTFTTPDQKIRLIAPDLKQYLSEKLNPVSSKKKWWKFWASNRSKN